MISQVLSPAFPVPAELFYKISAFLCLCSIEYPLILLINDFLHFGGEELLVG